MKPTLGLVPVATALALLAPRLAAAACDPGGADAADVANARAAVAAHCSCSGAATHADYVRCATAEASAALQNQGCLRIVRDCAARSTCGRPGFVTCCRTTRGGHTACGLKRDGSRCVAPRGGGACVGTFKSCCDACAADGCRVVPCAGSAAPECGGTCPPEQVCAPQPLEGNACDCFPDGTQPCGDSVAPLCNGTCPSGQRCGLESLLGGCFCVPEGATACGEAGLACGTGYCAPGDECSLINIPGLSYCGCAPAGAPCCQGGTTCPAGQSCFVAPGICGCF